MLEECPGPQRRLVGATTLGALRESLFEKESPTVAALDGTVQWIRVCDAHQEVDIAAGMAQKILAEHPDLNPSDIGLLVPSSSEYQRTVRSVFGLAGLALSGLPQVGKERDLAYEVVYHALHCLQPHPRVMAAAAVLSSPLMRWSETTGMQMAQQIMDGEPFLRARRSGTALA